MSKDTYPMVAPKSAGRADWHSVSQRKNLTMLADKESLAVLHLPSGGREGQRVRGLLGGNITVDSLVIHELYS